MWQAHHLTVGGIGSQNVRTHSANVFSQRHHQFLTDGVDGGVRHLCKLLTEIVEEHLRTVANDCQRRIVTHRCHRFLTGRGHRNDSLINVLLTIAKLYQSALQVADAVIHLAATLQLLQLHAILREPFAIRMSLRQLLLNLAVVVYLAFLRVDEQNLSWLQASLRHYITRLKIHHANFRRYDHHPLLGDGIATGAQTVSIQHAARIASVAEQQGGRTVPWFHQYRMVFVERLQVLADRVLVVKTFRYEYRHCLRQRQSTHHQELKHVVERGGVAHSFLHDGAQVLDVT